MSRHDGLSGVAYEDAPLPYTAAVATTRSAESMNAEAELAFAKRQVQMWQTAGGVHGMSEKESIQHQIALNELAKAEINVRTAALRSRLRDL